MAGRLLLLVPLCAALASSQGPVDDERKGYTLAELEATVGAQRARMRELESTLDSMRAAAALYNATLAAVLVRLAELEKDHFPISSSTTASVPAADFLARTGAGDIGGRRDLLTSSGASGERGPTRVTWSGIETCTANITGNLYIAGEIYWHGRRWGPRSPTEAPSPLPTPLPTRWPTLSPTPSPVVVSFTPTPCWACSSDCRTITADACGASGYSLGDQPHSSGKWYVEVVPSKIDEYHANCDTFAIGLFCVADCAPSYPLGDTTGNYVHWYSNGLLWTPEGVPYDQYGLEGFCSDGAVIGVAFDGDADTLQFYHNGVAQGLVDTDGITFGGTWVVDVADGSSAVVGAAFTINAAPAYPVPAGFKYWAKQWDE